MTMISPKAKVLEPTSQLPVRARFIFIIITIRQPRRRGRHRRHRDQKDQLGLTQQPASETAARERERRDGVNGILPCQYQFAVQPTNKGHARTKVRSFISAWQEFK